MDSHSPLHSSSYRIYWTELLHLAMEKSGIPRLPTTTRRTDAPTPTTGAHVTRPVANLRLQTHERRATGIPSLARPRPGAAPIRARPVEGSPLPGPAAAKSTQQLPTSSPANRSQPNVGPQSSERTRALRNFSRPQAAAAATTFATRQPATAPQRVREVGFENWARRHESISALPQPARGSDYARAGIVRSFRGRVPSVRERDEELLSPRPSGVFSLETVSEDQEEDARWQDASRRPLRARAPAVRSQAASIACATESSAPSARAVVATRPPSRRMHSQQQLPSSRLRPAAPGAAENPLTYLEMQPRYSRAPTRLAPSSHAPPGADAAWGENYSRWSRGTTVRDIQRRKDLTTKFPLPGNMGAGGSAGYSRQRVFSGDGFVDAPGLLGRPGFGQRGTLMDRIDELKAQGLRGRVLGEIDEDDEGAAAAASVPESREGDVAATEKGKGKWRRISGFFARKFGRKGKETLSLEMQTFSPRVAGGTPSLVHGSSSDEVLSPATPAPIEAEQPVVVVRPPVYQEEHPMPVPRAPSPLPLPERQARICDASTKASSVSLDSSSELEDTAQEAAAAAAATSLALRREYDELIGHLPEVVEEEEEEGEDSPLQAFDFDLFPSAHASSERWSSAAEMAARNDARLEAVADAIAEEETAANWAGTQQLVAREQSVSKGKARVVDVPGVRSRYAGKRGVVGQKAGEGAAEGRERRDTVGGEEEKSVGAGNGSGNRRPVVAISGLRS